SVCVFPTDGSSNGNPPERCPRPLYSRDSTQEDHTIPHHHQSGNLRDPKVEVKEEIKEEDDEDGVMEEIHKDLYQDTMVESSSSRNPPERCPRPLYSRDSTQEGHTIPHHHQNENPKDNIVVKEEYKEEDEEYGVMEEFSDGHKDMMEPPNTRNPPERCPRPLYSRDSTQEGLTIPHCYKSGDPIDIEFEVKPEEEERYVRDDQQSMEEDGITGTFIEEDTPTEISTDCKVEDEDITQYSPGENPTTSNVHPAPHSVDGPSYSSYPEEPQTVRDGAGPSYSSYPEEPQTVRDGAVLPTDKRFSCTECGKCFYFKFNLDEHKRAHTVEEQHSCPECGKFFFKKAHLSQHQRSHTEPQTVRDGAGPSYSSYPEEPQTVRDGAGPSYSSYPEEPPTVRDGAVLSTDKRFSCTECGKSFFFKFNLDEHKRSHTVEKPLSCPDCGKCFLKKAHLSQHQKSHAEEKPFSCPECGKRFLKKSHISLHQKSHTEKKLYSCSDVNSCKRSVFPIRLPGRNALTPPHGGISGKILHYGHYMELTIIGNHSVSYNMARIDHSWAHSCHTRPANLLYIDRLVPVIRHGFLQILEILYPCTYDYSRHQRT
ncbi:hypothetical protein AB205_0184940, partial [Aquarana catesbeiana]